MLICFLAWSQQLIILALHKGSQNVVRGSVAFHGNTVYAACEFDKERIHECTTHLIYMHVTL